MRIHVFILILILVAVLTGLPPVYIKLYDLGNAICWIIVSALILRLVERLKNLHIIKGKELLLTSLSVYLLIILSVFNFSKFLIANVHTLNIGDYLFFLIVLVCLFKEYKRKVKTI